MNLMSTTEAAKLKGVSRQAILDAVRRGALNGQKVGGHYIVVKGNKKFEAWEPVAVRQKAGKARARKAKKAKSKR